MKQLEERYKVELQKNKDAWSASEKVRWERWQASKTQEIKELTVKGLQPEFEKIFKKHKEEVWRLTQEADEKLVSEKTYLK